jgi:hypothetical protein
MSDFDKAQFRLDFPEFSDEVKYPDSMITFWSGLGDKLLHTRRWGDLRPEGLALYTAHNIVLAAQNVEDGAAGAAPGAEGGLIASESAGPLSVNLDTQSTIEQDGGNYNLTNYGTQFLRLSRIVGMGGAYV